MVDAEESVVEIEGEATRTAQLLVSRAWVRIPLAPDR
jgi:hypothetical protein